MNILLLNELPSKVLIGGLEVSISASFKTSITFENSIKNYDLEDEEQSRDFYINALKLYYPILNEEFETLTDSDKMLFNHIIDNRSEAINQLMWFYKCGKENVTEEETETKVKEHILDYDYDAKKIVSAILSQYGIDLTEIDVHWWKFKYMIEGLEEKHPISKIMSIRATDITTLPKEMREQYRKLKKICKIPLPVEEVEEDNEIADILLNGGEIPKQKA